MSKTREINSISSDTSEDEQLQLSELIGKANVNAININNNLFYQIGLAYYKEKLEEIGSQPIVRVKGHIRNDEFCQHKNTAYSLFNLEKYDDALSSFNNIIRDKYTRIINNFRDDIDHTFFYNLGKTYYSCRALNKSDLLHEPISTPSVKSNSIQHSEMVVKEKPQDTLNNFLSTMKNEISPTVFNEEMTPEVIDEEGLVFNRIYVVEKTSAIIAEEYKQKIKSEAKNNSTPITHTPYVVESCGKEQFYKMKKLHLFKPVEKNIDNKNETPIVKIKLDAPIMNKNGKGWKLHTVTVNTNETAKPFFNKTSDTSSKRKKRSQEDEDYIPVKKVKK